MLPTKRRGFPPPAPSLLPPQTAYLLVLQDALLLLLHPPALHLVWPVAPGDHVASRAVSAAHFAAGAGGLVDERAGGTRPTGLGRGGREGALPQCHLPGSGESRLSTGEQGAWAGVRCQLTGGRGELTPALGSTYLHRRIGASSWGRGRSSAARKDFTHMHRVQEASDLSKVRLPVGLFPACGHKSLGISPATFQAGGEGQCWHTNLLRRGWGKGRVFPAHLCSAKNWLRLCAGRRSCQGWRRGVAGAPPSPCPPCNAARRGWLPLLRAGRGRPYRHPSGFHRTRPFGCPHTGIAQ